MTDNEKKQIDEMRKDLVEIFDEEYEKRRLITADNTAEKMTAKGYRKQAWISVDERLPDRDGKYLVAREECGRYSISVRKFRKEVPCWYTGYCGHWERRTNGITHWMPLPEAPKMKGGDNDA